MTACHISDLGFYVVYRRLFLPVLLLLSACSSAPRDLSKKDVVTVPEIADQVGAVDNTSEFAPKMPDIHVPNDQAFNLWWRYTGNQDLEILIDRAISNNQLLQIAAQRIVQAKARAVQAGAGNKPSITALAGYTVDAPADGVGTVPIGGSVEPESSYEIGLSGGYTFDLWGQQEALRQSAHLRLKQAVFQYDAQLLNIISSLSKSYFEYLSLNDRIRNARETEKALTSMLLAMEERYAQGDATIVELQIQRSAVFNSRVRLPTLIKDREQLGFEIARLTGVVPGRLQLTDKGLNSVSLTGGVRNIATAYLLRRPDIRAIESGMLAADADLDVARKALLPGLSLTASLSSAAREPADLFQPTSLLWGVVNTLSASVFDGGTREQEVKFAQAVRNELVESYANTVYNAMAAARTAITELEFSGERLEMQRQSAEAAKIANDYGFESYSVGGVDFLTYLDSMQSYQDRQDRLYELELEYYQAFVDFYAAFAGGIPYRGVAATSPVFLEGNPQAGEQGTGSLPAVTVSRKDYRIEGWLDEPEYFSDDPWTVKLTGVYDRFAVDALLRDMPRRYESMKPAETVWVERVDVDLTDPEYDEEFGLHGGLDPVWYSVNFTGFENRKQALAWCEQLRAQQQRCLVYQPEENFEYVGRFDVAELEKRAYMEGESILAKRHAAERDAQTAQYRKANGENFGQLYSLLKIEDRHAWLIGNRSFRVWRFPVGASLAYDGKLKSINPSRAIISFDNRDYLLKPLYQVEAVETGINGQLFARMRWGGKEGHIYYHRTGDKLYGKGVIESITRQRVVVKWDGKRLVLPVMDR